MKVGERYIIKKDTEVWSEVQKTIVLSKDTEVLIEIAQGYMVWCRASGIGLLHVHVAKLEKIEE